MAVFHPEQFQEGKDVTLSFFILLICFHIKLVGDSHYIELVFLNYHVYLFRNEHGCCFRIIAWSVHYVKIIFEDITIWGRALVNVALFCIWLYVNVNLHFFFLWVVQQHPAKRRFSVSHPPKHNKGVLIFYRWQSLFILL